MLRLLLHLNHPLPGNIKVHPRYQLCVYVYFACPFPVNQIKQKKINLDEKIRLKIVIEEVVLADEMGMINETRKVVAANG